MDENYEQGLGYLSQGNFGDCILAMNMALIAHPDFVDAWNKRAVALAKLGHPFDAIMNYDKAIELNPTAEFYNNRGASYFDLGEFDRAIEDYEKALSINPKIAQSWNNIGNVFMQKRETSNAITNYRKAISADPNYVDGHLGLAIALLENGEFKEGWKEFEWRWKSEQAALRGLPFPEWTGEKGNGGLLFYGEQGHGDSLQFMRYAAQIKERWGGKVYVEVRHPLARIAKTLKGIDGIVTLGEKLPDDIQVVFPMMSAPRLLGEFGKINYLTADPHRSKLWKETISKLPYGFKIGVCWSGGARPFNTVANSIDKRRSSTLDAFAPLVIPGVSFVSLQMGPAASQVKTPPRGMNILDPSEDIHDFYDTAALMDNLDLIISVDTAVVHLAGALGKPVWLLSRHDNCWRWLKDRRDSPWYPSLTQFRQPSSGDWNGMMFEVRRELQKFLSQRMAA